MKRMRPRRWVLAGAGATAIAAIAVGWSLYRHYRAVAAVPTAAVVRRAFVDEVRLRGEIKPLRTATVNAPTASGDLRIVKLAKNGSNVRHGDLVIQFDTTMLERTLDEKRSELKQAEAEIARFQGDARIKDEQDLTELAKSKYDVERAKLDASTEELISRVSAEKFKLALADARQKQAETEARLEADRRGALADLESRKQKRDKAALEVAKAERDIAAMSLRAPTEGTIGILNNWRAGGVFGNGREFREGDRAWSGAAIAEIPDLTQVEVVARVDEADRGRVQPGQAATIRVDALPDRELAAQVDSISALAKVVFEGWPPVKRFEMHLRLADSDPRLKSGMSASVGVATERLERQLIVPVKAVFQKAGRQVAYVRRGLAWDERTVAIGRRSAESLLATSGLVEGERVALRDPTVPEAGTR